MKCAGCGKELTRARMRRLHSWDESPLPYCDDDCWWWAQMADIEEAVQFNYMRWPNEDS